MSVDGVIHQRPADAGSVERPDGRKGETAFDGRPAEQRAPVEGQPEVRLGLQEDMPRVTAEEIWGATSKGPNRGDGERANLCQEPNFHQLKLCENSTAISHEQTRF